MTPAELTDAEIAEIAQDLRARGETFAIATVIRAVGSTAAKPGAKALLAADGTILSGWIGGGCVRGALKAAMGRAVETGAPELVCLRPQDVLEETGMTAGVEVEGARFARNGCPSRGSLDVFLEPVRPLPELLVFGASPVARALVRLAQNFQWSIVHHETAQASPRTNGKRMIVIATQGQGDLDCLRAALGADSDFVAFVGSRRKYAALSDKLRAEGVGEEALTAVQAPAGLHIDAVTPEEIALSILAQLTRERRRNLRAQEVSHG